MVIDSKRWLDRVRGVAHDLRAGLRQTGLRSLVAGALAFALLAPALVHAADAPTTLTLTVQPGDTLVGIGERYLEQPSRWVELARLNQLRNPNRLQPGAQLRIPLDWMRWNPLAVDVVHVYGVVQGNRGPLAVGMRLSQGDRFDTGAEGALTLRFSDGSVAVFPSQTRASLGVSEQAPLGEVRATRIDLEQGAVETQVPPLRTPASRFDVKTPRVVTAVRGTRFRVAQDAQASRHEVLEGRVAVQGVAPMEVQIAQGSGLRAEGGQLGAVVPLLGAPDLSTIPARIERTSQLLQVPPLPGTVGWRWQVATDGAFTQLVQNVKTRDPRWLLSGLPDGDYFLRVRGADAQELEGADAQVAFALRARPEPPLKLSPPAGASVISSAPLVWTQVDGATNYRLQVSRDAAFTDLLVDQNGIAGTRKLLEPALAPGTYHWRLATQRPDGSHGPFGDPASFTVLEPSSVLPPQLGADGLQLAWSGPSGFQHQVQVARNSDFLQPELDRQVPGSSLTLPDPKPGAYFVRTRLMLPDGSLGPWSSTQRFDVPEPPAPPAAPAPPPSHPWYLLLILLLPLL